MNKSFQIFVDRLEGEMAVLLLCKNTHEMIIPKKYLPEGAGEGSVITAILKLEPELTAKAHKDVCSLITHLTHGEKRIKKA
ncbi:MAG: DUF3006 domain-containing protein [Armatimonadota bacterium]|jgi:hypothetical protein